MSKFIVEAPNGWFLRGTVWTCGSGHRDMFETAELAEAAKATAAKFSRPSISEHWKVVPVG